MVELIESAKENLPSQEEALSRVQFSENRQLNLFPIEDKDNASPSRSV